MPNIGVFPVHNNIFKIGSAGRASVGGQMVVVKDLETFSPSIDASTEEWSPMDTAGWVRRAVTGKGLSFSFSGKRQYGDPGNDYIAGLLLSTGQAVESVFEWTLPNSDKLVMNCVINLSTPAGGDSTSIDALEFEVLSDGLPVYTANASAPLLTFVTVDGTAALNTKIASVSPVLGGSNSYFYKMNVSVPTVGTIVSVATGWSTYTLNADLPAVNNNTICLVEAVTATGATVKGGTATVVVV